VASVAGEVETCGGPVHGIHTDHVAWSPDGRRAAFTENAALFYRDSDVLVMDRDTASYSGGPTMGTTTPT
jgi:Tol biopolymer transport system component